MREPFSRARAYFTTLLMLKVCLGMAIIMMTAWYQYILGAYMGDTERRMLRGQFFNTYLLGCQLIAVYLCSLGMWRSLWSRRCTPNVALLLSVWMFFCFLIVLCGFGTVWGLWLCAPGMERAAETSLLKGIDLYYTFPEWKLLWDGLQYHKQCCGVHGYKDWMHAAWMPADALQNDQNNDCREVTLAPYACCKLSCPTCYENYVPRADSSRIPYLNLTQINSAGCLPLFNVRVWQIVYVLLVLVIVALKLDIMICFFAKYIIRNQEPDGDGGCDNGGFSGDQGRPMVIVKCPSNVRCVTMENDDIDLSTCQFKRSKKPAFSYGNAASPPSHGLQQSLPPDLQQTLEQTLRPGMTLKEAVAAVQASAGGSLPNSQSSNICDCYLKGGGGTSGSRILH